MDTDTTKGDSPSAAGTSLRQHAASQRRLRRQQIVLLALTAAASLIVLSIAAAALFVPLDTALTIGAYIGTPLAIAGAAAAYPERSGSSIIAAAASASIFVIGGCLDSSVATRVVAALFVAATAVSVYTTRRTRRSAAIPTFAATAVTVLTFTVATLLADGHSWWWLPPSLAAAFTALGWRAEWALTLRARRAAHRSKIDYVAGYPRRPKAPKIMDEQNLAVGAAAERATGSELAKLGPGWHVLHSRALHNTAADADHIVIGPPGIILVDTKHRTGTLHCEPWVDDDGTTGADWSFNDEPVPGTLAASTLFEAERIAWAFRAPTDMAPPVPAVIAMHGVHMNVPWGTITFEKHVTGEDGEELTAGRQSVTFVDAENLAEYLRQLPARDFGNPTSKEKRDAKKNGATASALRRVARGRYISDLATVANHLFIPTS